MRERVNELKKEVCGLFEACNNVVEQMNLVDTLQHLCVDHHFKEQVGVTLSSIHSSELKSSSLHEVALRFRLLRHEAFWVSPGVYSNCKIVLYNTLGDWCYISMESPALKVY